MGATILALRKNYVKLNGVIENEQKKFNTVCLIFLKKILLVICLKNKFYELHNKVSLFVLEINTKI